VLISYQFANLWPREKILCVQVWLSRVVV